MIDDVNLTIGPMVFPIDYFDIGGMSNYVFKLYGTDDKYHEIMLLGKDGLKLPAPTDWTLEPYDPSKLKHLDKVLNKQ